MDFNFLGGLLSLAVTLYLDMSTSVYVFTKRSIFASMSWLKQSTEISERKAS